jgi:TetR/AcrR family transcriptional regulator, transcriptional repressor for nem operon
MTKLARDKRQRLIESAARLAHENGLAKISLADIAKAANVPLGNVYYYFKSRDDLLLDVINWRLARNAELLARLDSLSTPRQRLIGFLNARSQDSVELAEHGCAIGSLAAQMKSENRKLAKAAEDLLSRQLQWAQQQFRFLGQGAAAKSCALHLISSLQGIAVMAHGLDDPDLVKMEMTRLRQWIVSL